MYTHSQTQTVISVPYKRWLMISGRGSWAQEVQSGSDFINTSWHEHHLHALTAPPNTHSHKNPPISISACDIVPFMLLLHQIFPVAVMREVRWWVMRGWLGRVGVSQGQALHALPFLGSLFLCRPAWGCLWQQPLQQIIEQQMKTNDMIAERVPAVNLPARWFTFKAIDQLYNLSSWPGN